MTVRRKAWPVPDAPSGILSGGILAGRYELEALLGAGGAADVYRGTDLRLQRPVAVKVFRTGHDAPPESHFTDEARLQARLRNPGLVTVYDAGLHKGRSFLVMQLVGGGTLRQRITGGTLGAQATAQLGNRLARTLAHVHASGIIHRDVKPSNVLLDTDGSPYLADFGISRLVDATTRTHPGGLTGTAAYLAPEQVLGRRVGMAADVYALGLVLLECLTGRLEYDGAPLESAMARLHRAPTIPTSVPAALARLLREMTDSDPQARPDALACADRFATAPDASQAAKGVATADGAGQAEARREPTDAGPTHQQPHPSQQRTARRWPRWSVAVGGAAVLAATLGLGVAYQFGTGQSAPADRRTPATVSEPRPAASSGSADTVTTTTETDNGPTGPSDTAGATPVQPRTSEAVIRHGGETTRSPDTEGDGSPGRYAPEQDSRGAVERGGQQHGTKTPGEAHKQRQKGNDRPHRQNDKDHPHGQNGRGR